MRIFISFASEQEDQAEPIALALRAAGHTVFFSKDDLPAGSTYDSKIEKAIIGSNRFLFLLSPESVVRGRYTLTELYFAKRKWAHPGHNVLPVMLHDTALELVPNYLKAVTIFYPKGNAAAEISSFIGDRSLISQITLPSISFLSFIVTYIIFYYGFLKFDSFDLYQSIYINFLQFIR